MSHVWVFKWIAWKSSLTFKISPTTQTDYWTLILKKKNASNFQQYLEVETKISLKNVPTLLKYKMSDTDILKL